VYKTAGAAVFTINAPNACLDLGYSIIYVFDKSKIVTFITRQTEIVKVVIWDMLANMRVVLSKSPKVQIHRFIHVTLVTSYKPVPTVQNV